MRILIDTREQRPFTFHGYDCEVETATLPTGDYSLAGHESLVGIERKASLDELVNCLSHDRDRFERELSRARDFHLFVVIIEGRFEDLVQGNYRSRMTPKAAVASIAAFSVRYSPFLFCGSRTAAERLTYELLAKFAREESMGYSIQCAPARHCRTRVHGACNRQCNSLGNL